MQCPKPVRFSVKQRDTRMGFFPRSGYFSLRSIPFEKPEFIKVYCFFNKPDNQQPYHDYMVFTLLLSSGRSNLCRFSFSPYPSFPHPGQANQ